MKNTRKRRKSNVMLSRRRGRGGFEWDMNRDMVGVNKKGAYLPLYFDCGEFLGC